MFTNALETALGTAIKEDNLLAVKDLIQSIKQSKTASLNAVDSEGNHFLDIAFLHHKLTSFHLLYLEHSDAEIIAFWENVNTKTEQYIILLALMKIEALFDELIKQNKREEACNFFIAFYHQLKNASNEEGQRYFSDYLGIGAISGGTVGIFVMLILLAILISSAAANSFILTLILSPTFGGVAAGILVAGLAFLINYGIGFKLNDTYNNYHYQQSEDLISILYDSLQDLLDHSLTAKHLESVIALQKQLDNLEAYDKQPLKDIAVKIEGIKADLLQFEEELISFMPNKSTTSPQKMADNLSPKFNRARKDLSPQGKPRKLEFFSTETTKNEEKFFPKLGALDSVATNTKLNLPNNGPG